MPLRSCYSMCGPRTSSKVITWDVLKTVSGLTLDLLKLNLHFKKLPKVIHVHIGSLGSIDLRDDSEVSNFFLRL